VAGIYIAIASQIKDYNELVQSEEEHLDAGDHNAINGD